MSEKRKGKRVVNSPRDYSPFPCGSGSRTALLMGSALYPLVSLSGSSGQTVYTKHNLISFSAIFISFYAFRGREMLF